MIYKLLEPGSPSLSVELPDTSFDVLKTKYNLTPQELYDNLKGTMAALGGIGLSANQCGITERVFVMYTNLEAKEIAIYFNPRVTWLSEETDYFTEGCLTYPFLFLNVKRPKAVEFTYMDLEGKEQKGKFSGLTARVFLHEYDHMEGKNFTQMVSKLKLEMGKKRAAKKFKKAVQRASAS